MSNRDTIARTGADNKGLRNWITVFREAWWIPVLCALVSACAALAVGLFQHPVYQSTTSLYITSTSPGDSAVAAYQGSMASRQRVGSYSDLAESDGVLRDAVSRLGRAGISVSVDGLKSKISTYANPETVLLQVSARDVNAVVAAHMADAVSSALVDYVAVLETPSGGGSPLAKLTIVSPARVGQQVTPRLARNVGLGLVGGLCVGALIVIVRSRFDQRLLTDVDVERIGGADAEVLAAVPLDDHLRDTQRLDFTGGSTPTTEAYRRLRANLEFKSVDMPARVVAVSSAGAGDGKTTTAVHLSLALADNGSSVVLVGADLRLPSLSNWFNSASTLGLTDWLLKRVDLSDVVQDTGITGLSVLPCGDLPPNPSELLGSDRAREAISVLRELFDYVVVDCAPIFPVIDALEVGRWVDGMVVVVRLGSTTGPVLVDALHQLDTAHIRVLGLVLNRSERLSSGYGYLGYYASAASPS